MTEVTDGKRQYMTFSNLSPSVTAMPEPPYSSCASSVMIGQMHLLGAYFFNCAGPPMKAQLTKNQLTLSLVITSYRMHAPAQMFRN